ncbi:hypothetical protein [Cuspidothrix issatschenkoi]|uniref:DUF2281 domain-containing protein n=1 Tax=Cuspidothrix issatschenkoi CHARLIE-1 TaxID=2052836 RepID=A0A2S6CZT7_9CYAN|nr:hypothetical protein [Cuspidothrix issatschenkoi]PPJ65219.1 hypothetical protein CUN59_00755 [Cuspidothrix issatschenkoi CHARLIE-1]
MTQAIDQHIMQENILLDKFRNLTSEEQQTILDFVEFMYRKKNGLPENREVSAYDLAKEWAGSVDSGIGDLSTNKKYLQAFGK